MTAPAEVEVAEVTQADDSNEIRVRLPVVVIEGMDTADGRFLTPGGLTCRALPISLLACPASAHGGQDPEAAQVIGRIDSLTRRPGAEILSPRTGEPFPEGTFVWSGEGVIQADHPIADLVRRRYLRGVSVDLSGMDVELVGEGETMADADHPRRRMIAHSAEVSAVTIVPLPAFGDAYVELVGDDEPMAPADPEEFPDGFAASAFPAWRSAEVGDYPALTAAGEAEGMAVVMPADAVDQLAAVIADDNGEQRDASELAVAIVAHIEASWPSSGTGTEVPVDREAVVAAAETPVPDPILDDEVDKDTGLPDAPQDCEFGDHPATRSLLFDDNTKYVPVCDDDEQQGRGLIGQNGATVTRVVEIREPDRLDADEETQP